MRGTRFEFGGTGMFHALDLLEEADMTPGDAGDYEYAYRQFEERLPVPDTCRDTGNTVSYFTDDGLKAFEEPIRIYLDLFDRYLSEAGTGEIVKTVSDIPDGQVLYRDRYQVTARKGETGNG